MKKINERKLIHWLDIEFSWLHVYVLVVIWLLVDGWLPHMIVGGLMALNVLYGLRRAVWLAKVDSKYLRVKSEETE